MIITTPCLVLLSLVNGIIAQSFWSNLEENVEQNQGWRESQMMATNTTTPAYDPNTSTPGSTIGLQSVTKLSVRRKIDMRGHQNKMNMNNNITQLDTTHSLVNTSVKTHSVVEPPVVPLHYEPLREMSVTSPSVPNNPIKFNNKPSMVEIAPNSPYGVPISFKYSSNTAKLNNNESTPSLSSSSSSENPLQKDSNGIPVSMSQSKGSASYTVDSNIDLNSGLHTYNLIMEPVAEFKSSNSRKADSSVGENLNVTIIETSGGEGRSVANEIVSSSSRQLSETKPNMEQNIELITSTVKPSNTGDNLNGDQKTADTFDRRYQDRISAGENSAVLQVSNETVKLAAQTGSAIVTENIQSTTNEMAGKGSNSSKNPPLMDVGNTGIRTGAIVSDATPDNVRSVFEPSALNDSLTENFNSSKTVDAGSIINGEYVISVGETGSGVVNDNENTSNIGTSVGSQQLSLSRFLNENTYNVTEEIGTNVVDSSIIPVTGVTVKSSSDVDAEQNKTQESQQTVTFDKAVFTGEGFSMVPSEGVSMVPGERVAMGPRQPTFPETVNLIKDQFLAKSDAEVSGAIQENVTDTLVEIINASALRFKENNMSSQISLGNIHELDGGIISDQRTNIPSILKMDSEVSITDKTKPLFDTETESFSAAKYDDKTGPAVIAAQTGTGTSIASGQDTETAAAVKSQDIINRAGFVEESPSTNGSLLELSMDEKHTLQVELNRSVAELSETNPTDEASSVIVSTTTVDNSSVSQDLKQFGSQPAGPGVTSKTEPSKDTVSITEEGDNIRRNHSAVVESVGDSIRRNHTDDITPIRPVVYVSDNLDTTTPSPTVGRIDSSKQISSISEVPTHHGIQIDMIQQGSPDQGSKQDLFTKVEIPVVDDTANITVLLDVVKDNKTSQTNTEEHQQYNQGIVTKDTHFTSRDLNIVDTNLKEQQSRNLVLKADSPPPGGLVIDAGFDQVPAINSPIIHDGAIVQVLNDTKPVSLQIQDATTGPAYLPGQINILDTIPSDKHVVPSAYIRPPATPGPLAAEVSPGMLASNFADGDFVQSVSVSDRVSHDQPVVAVQPPSGVSHVIDTASQDKPVVAVQPMSGVTHVMDTVSHDEPVVAVQPTSGISHVVEPLVRGQEISNIGDIKSEISTVQSTDQISKDTVTNQTTDIGKQQVMDHLFRGPDMGYATDIKTDISKSKGTEQIDKEQVGSHTTDIDISKSQTPDQIVAGQTVNQTVDFKFTTYLDPIVTGQTTSHVDSIKAQTVSHVDSIVPRQTTSHVDSIVPGQTTSNVDSIVPGQTVSHVDSIVQGQTVSRVDDIRMNIDLQKKANGSTTARTRESNQVIAAGGLVVDFDSTMGEKRKRPQYSPDVIDTAGGKIPPYSLDAHVFETKSAKPKVSESTPEIKITKMDPSTIVVEQITTFNQRTITTNVPITSTIPTSKLIEVTTARTTPTTTTITTTTTSPTTTTTTTQPTTTITTPTTTTTTTTTEETTTEQPTTTKPTIRTTKSTTKKTTAAEQTTTSKVIRKTDKKLTLPNDQDKLTLLNDQDKLTLPNEHQDKLTLRNEHADQFSFEAKPYRNEQFSNLQPETPMETDQRGQPKDQDRHKEPERLSGKPHPEHDRRGHHNDIFGPREPVMPEEKSLEMHCLHSAYIDGIGYAEYPGQCQKLVQCYQYRGKTVAVLRECPGGYFWHQDQVLCRPPSEVPCFDDPCLDIDVVHYNRSGGCRSFFSCDYGISVPECCEKGFRYNGVKCIPDPTCNDPCLTPNDLDNRLRYQSCKFLPDEYNPYGYITLEHNGLRIRACPSGTIFSARQCGCRWVSGSRGRRRMRECSPEFYMNFDHGFRELSGSNMAFDVSNVVINDGAAQFNGNGKITLWGYMNKELGKTFAIRLRFKPDEAATDSGSLISNCGMTGSPTIEIAMDKHKMKYSAKSMSFGKSTEITDHIDPYSWNDITYMYDGNNFVVMTNGFKKRMPLGGLLETRSNAIVIGGCPKPGSGFKGMIDNIEVFSGCIPREIFQSQPKQR